MHVVDMKETRSPPTVDAAGPVATDEKTLKATRFGSCGGGGSVSLATPHSGTSLKETGIPSCKCTGCPREWVTLNIWDK